MEGKYWGYHQAQPPVRGGVPTSGRLGRSWFPKDLLKCFGFSQTQSFKMLWVFPKHFKIFVIHLLICLCSWGAHPSQLEPGAPPAGEHRSRRGIDTSQAGFSRRGALPSYLPGQQHLPQARDPAPTDRHPEVRSDSSSWRYTRWVF